MGKKVKGRESFSFYRSFFESIMEIESIEERELMFERICEYALYHKEGKPIKGLSKVIWINVKPQLDANWRRYINGLKGADFGDNGGAPIGNQNASKQPQNNPQTTPNKNKKINKKIKEKIEDKRECDITPTHTSVIIQSVDDFSYSLEDCRLLFNEVGCFDETVIQNCFDYYNMRGWKTQKGVKITSLKSCVSNWLKMEIDRNTSHKDKARVERIKEYAAVAAEFRRNAIESLAHEVNEKEPPF